MNLSVQHTSLPVVCPPPRSHQHRFFCRAILRLISLGIPTSTVRVALLNPFYVSCRSQVHVARSLKNLKKIQDLQLKDASALDAGGWEAVGVFLSSFKNILLIFI